MIKVTHSFEVHSNDSACRKSGRLGLEQIICYMQVDTNWYWNQQSKHHVITVTTRKTLHPQFEVDAITDFREIPTSVCSRTQSKIHLKAAYMFD